MKPFLDVVGSGLTVAMVVTLLLGPVLARAAGADITNEPICLGSLKIIGLDNQASASVRKSVSARLAEFNLRPATAKKRCRGNRGAILEISAVRGGPVLHLSFSLLHRGTEAHRFELSLDVSNFSKEFVLPDGLVQILSASQSIRESSQNADPVPLTALPKNSALSPAPPPSGTEDSPAIGTQATPADASGHDRDRGGATWPWVAVGVGGATLIAAAATAGVTLGLDRSLENLCEDPNACDEPDKINRLENMALTTDILWGVGLVTVTAGILFLTVFDDEPTPDEPRLAVSPWVGSNVVGGALQAEF